MFSLDAAVAFDVPDDQRHVMLETESVSVETAEYTFNDRQKTRSLCVCGESNC